jgi:hypothetical protein
MNLSELKDQVIFLWKKMSNPKKIFTGIFILIVISGVILIYSRANKVEYVPLYSGLEENQAGAVIDKLEKSKIPYRITEGGKTITVPYEKADKIRLRFAGEGLPATGVGYEILDKKTWGMTNFLQKVNYKRALEGELTRTIRELEEVETARVHLALPEERLFGEDRVEPSASVLVRLKPGFKLSSSQAQGIATLLAHSIEGLNLSNVSIIDFNGNILFPEEKQLSSLDKSAVSFDTSGPGNVNSTAIDNTPAENKEKREAEKGGSTPLNSFQRYYWVLGLALIPFLIFFALSWLGKKHSERSFDSAFKKHYGLEPVDEFKNQAGNYQKTGTEKYLEFLEDENPQNISIILTWLEPAVAGEIFSQLTPEKQIEVAFSLSRAEEIPPEVKQRVWRAFESLLYPEKAGDLNPISDEKLKSVNGKKILSEILKFTDTSTRKRVLRIIEKEKVLT